MDPQPQMRQSATRRTTIGAILVASVAAAVPFILADGWPLAVFGLAFGALWLVELRRGRHRLASPLMAGYVILAALATGAGGSFLPPLTVVAALAAWDLDRFSARLDEAGGASETSLAERRGLEQQHLSRLLRVSLFGLALAWLALAVRVQLAFGVAVALGLVAALGLAALVRALIRESD
jgi:hypothetical protein